MGFVGPNERFLIDLLFFISHFLHFKHFVFTAELVKGVVLGKFYFSGSGGTDRIIRS